MRWGSPATGQDGIVPILYCTYRIRDLIVRKTGNSDFSVLSHREGGTGRPCYTGRPRKGQGNAPGSLIPALGNGDGRGKHHMWRATGPR